MTTMPGRWEPGRPRRPRWARLGIATLALVSLAGWGVEAHACRSTPPPTVRRTIRRTVRTTTVKPTVKPTTVVTTPTTPLPLPEVVKPVVPTTTITPTTSVCACVCPPSLPISPGIVRPQVQTPEPSTVVIGLALMAAGSLIQRRFRRSRPA